MGLDSSRLSGMRLHPFTLRFEDESLERRYQEEYNAAIIGLTRFGLLLTISLYFLFGFTDLWTMPERVGLTWQVRGYMATVLLGVLAFSWTRVFARHQQEIMLATVLITGANIALLFALMSGESEYQHFVGMFLLTVGSYAVLGLQFHYTMIVGLATVVYYAVVDFLVKDFTWTTSFINLLFLFSTMVITAAGARNADRQRRLAYEALRQVEHEREAVVHLSLHDPLTGLANRRLLMEKLVQAIARNARFETHAAVLFLDLDGFKAVNDRHGHAVGDHFLQEVAHRLEACVRETDTVVRLGGDEFVVLLEDLADPSDVEIAHARISDCFDRPVVVDGSSLTAAVSIGVALHPRDAATPTELLRAADKAMYRAKAERRRRN